MSAQPITETPLNALSSQPAPWVLCVDDDPNCVSAMHRFFHRYHVRFASAYNAYQAFHHITNKKPDLVISDVMMPGVRGTELVDWLRNNAVVCDIPLLILSGHGSDEVVDEAMRLGADSFLSKPIDQETLKNEIERFIPLRPRNLSTRTVAACTAGSVR